MKKTENDRRNIKLYIEYQFRDGPYGGANQFLKTLRDYLMSRGVYADHAIDADVVLINHTNISKETLRVKKEHPEKIFIHRMDGPVSKHRPRAKIFDWHSFYLDKLLCNGSVFQSTWTKENCFKLGYKQTGDYAIIHNAPNPQIFAKENQKGRTPDGKINLVTTSWSPNWNKGFDIIQYLDEHLDYSKYEYTFIGRTPISFKNITIIEPLASVELAKELKKHDIFVATSKCESCSNSLIEAIDCGLAIVARDSGCYREITGEGGEIFQKIEESIPAIKQVAEDLNDYQTKLPYYSIEDIGQQYYQFAQCLSNDINGGKIVQKQFGTGKVFLWNLSVIFIKIYTKCNHWYEKYILRL